MPAREFGGGQIGKVEVDFFSGPKPTGTYWPPSTALRSEKDAFGSSRRARWFGSAATKSGVTGQPADTRSRASASAAAQPRRGRWFIALAVIAFAALAAGVASGYADIAELAKRLSAVLPR